MSFKNVLFPTIAFLFFLPSCGPSPVAQPAPPAKPDPAVITYHPAADKTLTSTSAEVTVYFKDNRGTGDLQLRQKYRLRTKILAGQLLTRIDYSDQAPEGLRNKSVLSSTAGTLLIDQISGKIEQRLPAPPQPETGPGQALTLSARMKVNDSLDLARRLKWDLTTDPSGRVVCLDLPVSGQANQQAFPGKTLTRNRLSLDLVQQTLAASEIVLTEDDGTVTSITTKPVYQESEAELFKVAEITEITVTPPGQLDVSDRDLPPLESVESVPTVTAEELSVFQKAGAVISRPFSVAGDPANPAATTTIITTYDNIEANLVEDSVFERLLALGGAQ